MLLDGEAGILSRILKPNKPELPPPLVRLILQWDFSQKDKRRMHELLEKAKAGTLTRAERIQAENYERVGHFLSILKSKARISLKARNGDA